MAKAFAAVGYAAHALDIRGHRWWGVLCRSVRWPIRGRRETDARHTGSRNSPRPP